jgi:hypothetical protein
VAIIVKEAFNKQNRMETEREQRELNIIVHGVEESKKTTRSERIREDLEYSERLCSRVLEIQVEIMGVIRLGRF